MRGSFRLGSIAGIEISIHYTLVFAIILIAWSLAQVFFPSLSPRQNPGAYWLAGIIAALLLFVSVLIHELAHSLVARSRGLPVSGITLFIFGGVSNLRQEPEKPTVEFAMAIVGPLTSLALAGIFWGIRLTIGTSISLVPATVYYLAYINALLAGFNILPGFPLDGGRVLRSILWKTTGNLVKATNIAATVGRFLGWAIIAYGLYQLLTGNFLGGIWIAFVGWFLSSAADSSRQEVSMSEQLATIKVKEVMDTKAIPVAPETTVEDLVINSFRQYRRRAAPVLKDSQLLGIVTISDVRELPQEKWAQTTVETIMARQPLYSVSPEDDLNKAMKIIAEHGINQVLVVSDGKFAGMLSRADIIQHLQIRKELGLRTSNRRQ